jgi:hypothetical protein
LFARILARIPHARILVRILVRIPLARILARSLLFSTRFSYARFSRLITKRMKMFKANRSLKANYIQYRFVYYMVHARNIL